MTVFDQLDSFGRVLLYSQSSMTQLLELYFDDTICVRLLNQGNERPLSDFWGKDQMLLPNQMHREVVLVRQSTNEPLIYASSIVYLDHLPKKARDDLFAGKTPIGKIIDAYQLETYRIIKKVGSYDHPHISQVLNAGPLYYKYYTIYQQDNAIFDIYEFFPDRLVEKNNQISLS